MPPSPRPDPGLPPRPAAGLAALASACLLVALPVFADAGTKRGSFDRPPFYHGKAAASAGAIAHLPPGFLVGDALQADTANSAALRELLAGVAAEMERLGRTRRLPDPGPAPPGFEKASPRIRFGCFTAEPGSGTEGLLEGECDPATRRMRFDVEGPGRAWRERVGAVAGDSIGAVLVVQLGFGQHWIRQQDWKGNKAIELGSGHRVPVPWLTSLDDPIEVLELTGALVGVDGKVQRVGCEGLIARRTGMTASVLGAQEILTEQDLAALRDTRRDDLPDRPLAWQAALSRLIDGLLAPR